MGEFGVEKNAVIFLWAGFSVFACILIHFLYKIFLSKKKDTVIEETDKLEDAPIVEETVEASTTASRPAKSKKRAPWKGKTEFAHPWLLKNLKGHPGTVLHMDFSANGKFLAATCEEAVPAAEGASCAARRRKPRERRRPPAAPPAPPPARMAVEELAEALRPHLLSPQRMWTLGYPFEIEPNSCKAVVYVNPPPRLRPFTSWDVNAPEFVPGGSPGDSGRGSCGSSPRSDSDEEADAVERLCVRCDSLFRVGRDGEYLTREHCFYHWGRAGADRRLSCCGAPVGSHGCSTARLHVWSGTRPGMNGPLDGYVRARARRGGVYAIDTEMCYTAAGLELASVAVVAADGRLVYRALVRPAAPVIDHNTRFSGIRPRDLARATKTLRDVQNDILGFVGSDTILVGHALDNDLRALKLLHNAVVDTCALYPHARGWPLRRSLRALAAELLGRSVQRAAHSPLEDARAAMDLVLVKVQQERAVAATIASARLHGPPSPASLQPYDPLVCAA